MHCCAAKLREEGCRLAPPLCLLVLSWLFMTLIPKTAAKVWKQAWPESGCVLCLEGWLAVDDPADTEPWPGLHTWQCLWPESCFCLQAGSVMKWNMLSWRSARTSSRSLDHSSGSGSPSPSPGGASLTTTQQNAARLPFILRRVSNQRLCPLMTPYVSPIPCSASHLSCLCGCVNYEKHHMHYLLTRCMRPAAVSANTSAGSFIMLSAGCLLSCSS